MGTRGPVAKRMAERLGHVTKAQKASVNSIKVEGVVKPPPANREWHPIARRWFNSLKTSGQCVYFEPSDWAAAYLVAEAMTRNLATGNRFSGQLFATVWSAMSELLTTEGSRRRVRMEIERGVVDEDQDAVASEVEQFLAEMRQ